MSQSNENNAGKSEKEPWFIMTNHIGSFPEKTCQSQGVGRTNYIHYEFRFKPTEIKIRIKSYDSEKKDEDFRSHKYVIARGEINEICYHTVKNGGYFIAIKEAEKKEASGEIKKTIDKDFQLLIENRDEFRNITKSYRKMLETKREGHNEECPVCYGALKKVEEEIQQAISKSMKRR